MLELKGLSKHFGGIKAVDGLDLNVKSGEIFGLIGPNGSGKSTTINLICGLMDVTTGNIAIDGRDISGAAPHEVVRILGCSMALLYGKIYGSHKKNRRMAMKVVFFNVGFPAEEMLERILKTSWNLPNYPTRGIFWQATSRSESSGD